MGLLGLRPAICPDDVAMADVSVKIVHADCRDALKAIADATVDSCVTDPPYALTSNKKGGSGVASVNLESPYGRARIGTGNGAGGFMGKKWDTGETAFDPEFWREVLRVLKPGAHLVAFGGTRTYHRLACAIEDAGFEIREMCSWNYGSGFPKSHNVVKKLQESGLACRCSSTKVSSHHVRDEGLRNLQVALDAAQSVSSDPKSHMRSDMQRGAYFKAETGCEETDGDAGCDDASGLLGLPAL